ncbi:hypothetical protein T484DRAFT_3048194 [Baffinella frigidus]|nr:hypothetical protein T484DRAFT_3048194 [Cryptophyta sp. CCMP2293]
MARTSASPLLRSLPSARRSSSPVDLAPGLRLCALPWRRVRRARPPGRGASHEEGLLRRMGRSAAERVERGRLRGAGRELSGGHSLVARGGRRHAAGLEAAHVAQNGGSFSARRLELPLALIPPRAVCREMRAHHLLTKLDEAPWEWGSTGGWSQGMPKFFQGERPLPPGSSALWGVEPLLVGRSGWGTQSTLALRSPSVLSVSIRVGRVPRLGHGEGCRADQDVRNPLELRDARGHIRAADARRAPLPDLRAWGLCGCSA